MNSLLDVHRIPCDELDQLLAMFVLSDSNTDGQEYEPSYLRPSSIVGTENYVEKHMDTK